VPREKDEPFFGSIHGHLAKHKINKPALPVPLPNLTNLTHLFPMNSISIQQLQLLLAKGAPLDLIDVRTPAEFETIHVPGARSLPLDTLNCKAMLASRALSADEPIYILCHSGARAKKAAQQFEAANFAHCVVIEGGTQAWADAGLPVERGQRSVLPLDRQLQITIGILVLTGVVLSKLVAPAWIWLSGFVGAGLIFAGITGVCALRMVLASMPWNQASRNCSGGCCKN